MSKLNQALLVTSNKNSSFAYTNRNKGQYGQDAKKVELDSQSNVKFKRELWNLTLATMKINYQKIHAK